MQSSAMLQRLYGCVGNNQSRSRRYLTKIVAAASTELFVVASPIRFTSTTSPKAPAIVTKERQRVGSNIAFSSDVEHPLHNRSYSTTSILASAEQQRSNTNTRKNQRRNRGSSLGEQYNELVRKTERLLRSEKQQAVSSLDHQQLLANWLRVLSRMRDPKQTRQGTEYADRLAHKILNVRPAARDSILELAHSVFDDDDTKKGEQHKNATTEDEFSNVPGYIKEVTRAWAKVGEPELAESLLRHQMETYEQSGRYRPLQYTIAAVIHGFARDKHMPSADSLDKALYWFDAMEDPKNIEAYNAVLNAYANRGLAEKADELFRDMKEMCSSKLDGFSYSSVMQAWLRSRRHDAQEKIENLLQEMKDRYEAEGKPNRLLANSFVYGPAITLATPQRADALLRELQDVHDRTGIKSTKPGVRLYAKVMKRWADAGEPKEAEKLLLELAQAYEAGDQALRPNIYCFVTTISAYANQGTVQSAREAEVILNKMEEQILGGTFAFEISNYPYNIVMHAFCKNENADKAEEIFTRMKSLADSRKLRELQPDAVSYTTLMKALIAEAKPCYMAKVESLLKEMEESRTVKPDIIIYGTVLNALSMCGEADAGTRAEALVGRMAGIGVEPNRICYNCIINTYRELGNAAKAKEVLELMEHEGANGNVRSKPSARDYSACISAFAAEGLPDKEHFEEARRLFLTVADRYKAGDGNFRSSAAIITSLMDVLAKSELTGKAKVAIDIWEAAGEIDIEHDRRSYNALLKACSEEKGSPEEQLEALELAVKSFQLMRQGECGVNSTTFVYLMQCCSKLIPDETERIAATEEFFQNCCEAGIVNQDVISQFHQCVPASALLSDVLEDGVVVGGRIPQQWQESVPDSANAYARR